MKDVLKLLTVWVVCIAISIFTLIKVNPSHRVNVAAVITIVLVAPLFAVIGTGEYIIQELKVNWNKCILGCEGEK